jgi:hypothetical protein
LSTPEKKSVVGQLRVQALACACGKAQPQGCTLYLRYHPAFTAINGLRNIAWRGVGLSFPTLKPLVEQ